MRSEVQTPTGQRPAFLITIDTEGDNLWSRPRTITTRNAEFIPRFQALCERHSLAPTYLTNWEMANCEAFREFASDALRRGTAEVGMHLHAWNSPPDASLTGDDLHHQPYLPEYPDSVLREKVRVMTERLHDVFQKPICSHRAGRWGFNEVYAQSLAGLGYHVDCSVTPHYSWKDCRGSPDGSGGPDYRGFPDRPYLLDLDDIRSEGRSGLLELPVSAVVRPESGAWGVLRRAAARESLPGRLLNRLRPQLLWPYPGLQSFGCLLRLLRIIVEQRRPYFMLVLHSSELMPGGSPRFATAASVERLYDALEHLFDEGMRHCRGLTLRGFHETWTRSHGRQDEPHASQSPTRHTANAPA